MLRKLKELVAAGATVIGPKPSEASGLKDYPQCDAEVREAGGGTLAGRGRQNVKEQAFGKGRVIWGKTAREVLAADGIKPDFDFAGANPDAQIDYIHRRADGAEIYFVANRSNRWEEVRARSA